jgi:hypothetical protein
VYDIQSFSSVWERELTALVWALEPLINKKNCQQEVNSPVPSAPYRGRNDIHISVMTWALKKINPVLPPTTRVNSIRTKSG